MQTELDIILRECCNFYNTSKHQVVKRSRFKTAVEAKRSYCYICHKLGVKGSLNQLGGYIKLDHCSFIYHVRVATERAVIYKSYASQLDYLEHICRNEIRKSTGGNPYLMAMNNLGQAYLLSLEVDCKIF